MLCSYRTEVPSWKWYESASMPIRIGTFQRELKIILVLVSVPHHESKIHEKQFDRHSNFISCIYHHAIGSFLILSCVFPLMCWDGFSSSISKAYFSFSNHFHIQNSIRKHNILFAIQTTFYIEIILLCNGSPQKGLPSFHYTFLQFLRQYFSYSVLKLWTIRPSYKR